jgi:TRAP-type C4-dicarboxylate transport system permease small subunit
MDWLEDAFACVAAAMIVFTVFFVPLDVASRYFLGAPITWVYEVTEYILLMVPCLAMAWLARHNGHVVIDVATSRLGERSRARLASATRFAVAATCGFVAWFGAAVTLASFRADAVIENVLQTPQWMIYICIPLGFALTALEFARQGVHAAWNGG